MSARMYQHASKSDVVNSDEMFLHFYINIFIANIYVNKSNSSFTGTAVAHTLKL